MKNLVMYIMDWNSSLTYFLASILGFLLGPVLHAYLVNRKNWNQWIDGFTLASVGGIVLVHLLPEAVQKSGGIAFIFILLGIFLPNILEKYIFQHTKFNSELILLIGLLLHTGIESAALGNLRSSDSSHLGLAILLHRFPVGLLIFSYFKSSRGSGIAILLIGLITLTSILGFFSGSYLTSVVSEEYSIYLDIYVSATLLHVALENHTFKKHDHDHHDHGLHCDHSHKDRSTFYSGLGAILGFGLVLGFIGEPNIPSREPFSLSFLDTFRTLALESAPALFIGYFLAGVLGTFFRSGQGFLHSGNTISQTIKGVLFGLPLPICSCGVLPLYESLIRRGVPISASMGFLIATPELGIDAVLLSIPLLGSELTMARLVIAVLVAVLTGTILGTILPSDTNNLVLHAEDTREPFLVRLRKGLEFGFFELFDHTMPWILLGLFLAAVIEPLFAYESFRGIPPILQVPIFAVLGIPMYVCATGATPLAAIAIHKGISAGAAIAFLISGPATNLTTFAVLGKLHKKKGAIYFGALVTVLAILAGWGVNFFLLEKTEVLHPHLHDDIEIIQYFSLSVLLFLSLFSLMRQGARGFVDQILFPLK